MGSSWELEAWHVTKAPPVGKRVVEWRTHARQLCETRSTVKYWMCSLWYFILRESPYVHVKCDLVEGSYRLWSTLQKRLATILARFPDQTNVCAQTSPGSSMSWLIKRSSNVAFSSNSKWKRMESKKWWVSIFYFHSREHYKMKLRRHEIKLNADELENLSIFLVNYEFLTDRLQSFIARLPKHAPD